MLHACAPLLAHSQGALGAYASLDTPLKNATPVG